VFIHGLWLLPSCWDAWEATFEEAVFTATATGWPDDPATVEEARARPEIFAGKEIKQIKQIADHHAEVATRLARKPVVIGHSFGGLLTQMIAARGLAAASVAISPAPFRGVLPVPISALKASSPVLRNPANRHRAVQLTYEQFRYAFGNAISDAEARRLCETYSVPGSGAMIFHAAAASLNPWTEAKLDTKNPERGPLLIISADDDNTVPSSIAKATYKLQRRNSAVTEIAKVPGRGHSLTIDIGWRTVADMALAFAKRFI
jgi:non-heme chloroperoxidase